MTDEPIVEMRDIVKTFAGGVVANDGAHLRVEEGEIHGLLGENGAGKSTLMRILYGLNRADEGQIRLRGEPVEIDSPQQAINRGIGMVHQHFKLIPRLSVVENIILGAREGKGWFRKPTAASGNGDTGGVLRSSFIRSLSRRLTIGRANAAQRVAELADTYGMDIDPNVRVGELDIGEQQRVEILKVLYRDVDLLVLDEPTAVLTPQEIDRLFRTLRRLVDEGLSIIFITHKLDEITSITDRVTVMKDGATVDTVQTADTSHEELARMMVGREVMLDVEKGSPVEIDQPVLTATDIRAANDAGRTTVNGIDIEIRGSEIVGIVGVSGNGQRELVECLAGIRQPLDGSIRVNGKDMTGKGPGAFQGAGVGYVPEDRLLDGCVPELSIVENAILRDYRAPRFDAPGWLSYLDYDAAREYTEELVEMFDIRISSLDDKAKELSGGNLQKLVLGRELIREPDVLIAHQPTRGVDIGAIEFVRELLLKQRRNGMGILLVSESMDEVIDLSDRILVIYEGEIVHETTPEAVTREELGLYMTGGKTDETDDRTAVKPPDAERPPSDDGDGSSDIPT